MGQFPLFKFKLWEAKLITDFTQIDVTVCLCHTIHATLMQNGLFPTAPSQTRLAVSVDLLEFYFALFLRSSDAVNALSSALHSFYTTRGYQVLNEKVGGSYF